ncbi:MAG: DNA repair protein RecO C-terminal domain-containing protein [Treponema sp.]
MPRNYVTQGIIFSIKPQGENNSSVGFMTKDNGLVYATLYGGPKSKLRSLVSLWNSGTAYLYCKEGSDISKNVKVTDFDVQNYHLTFRENLYKTYAASLAAELIIKTKCAGSTEKCWYLVSGFFDGLEFASGRQCATGTVRFLWRYLDLLGIRPEISHCILCGREFFTGNSSGDRVLYNPVENGFTCSFCAEQDKKAHTFILSLEAARYLYAVSELSPAAVRPLPVSDDSLSEIKRLVFFLVEQASGTKLKTLETGTGIL